MLLLLLLLNASIIRGKKEFTSFFHRHDSIKDFYNKTVNSRFPPRFHICIDVFIFKVDESEIVSILFLLCVCVVDCNVCCNKLLRYSRLLLLVRCFDCLVTLPAAVADGEMFVLAFLLLLFFCLFVYILLLIRTCGRGSRVFIKPSYNKKEGGGGG